MGTEEQAIQEIVQNMVERGDGKVWMDNWRDQYRSLGGTPKDFMETRPDIFQLNFHGRGFSVELVGEGEQMAKDMGAESGTFKGGKGKGASKGASDGPVRGGPLGGVVLAEPIKGKGYGKGGDMMGGGGMSKGASKGGFNLAAPVGYGKGGFDGDFGGGCGYSAAAFMVPPNRGKMGGGGFGPPKGGGKKGGPAFAAIAAPSPAACGDLADACIQEIKEQMAARGEPKVWIEDWRDRYRQLGPSPKQFLEARPDVFRLHYTGKGYSVYLVEEEGGYEPPAAPMYKGGAAAQPQDQSIVEEVDTPDNQEDEQSCVDEISRLVRNSPDGRICILNWFKRFAHLAKSPRAFMEAWPDKFQLTFTGATYSVALVDDTPPELAAPKAAPAKRQPPMMLTATARARPVKLARTEGGSIAPAIGAGGHNNNPRHWTGPTLAPQPIRPAASISPADSMSAMDYLSDREEDALAEIFDQLSKPYSNGRINFPNWMERFGHLASNPRAFIEGHPDKFEIVPGPGASFTVDLC